jgi:hypothetical protein
MIAADYINQLLHPFTTTEKVPLGVYRVKHPALLDQIEWTVTTATTSGQVFHSAFGSKPAGRLDALVFLGRLEKQSVEIASRYGIKNMPLRARLGEISGKLGASPDPVVERWWATARILTQHDTPPVALNVICPNEACDTRGSLRVRLDSEEDMAVCTHCGQVWTERTQETFNRLVVWVRWASVHLVGPYHCEACEGDREARLLRQAQRAGVARVGSNPYASPIATGDSSADVIPACLEAS